MAGCAAVAVLASALPGVAMAQAFQANPTIVSGAITIDRSVANVDRISINPAATPTGVIDWSPIDINGTGNVNFLPAGNTAIFDTGTGAGDYTILNRIFPFDPARRVEFFGAVQSLNGGQTGGNLWFYSPGGIVLSGNARFDVGGLVLTTDNIDIAGGLFGTGGEIRFRGPANIVRDVTVGPSAQINALTRGSYVALVAPRIQNAGRIDVQGSAALIAAEAVDLKVNAGLFDITVTQGTTAATAVNQSGQITGPSAVTVNDNHNIYLVAVPKNQAMEMLLSGSIGYQPAVTAGIENGAVVLSAGYNIDSAAASIFEAPQAGSPTGNILIGNANVTSDLAARASHDVELKPTLGGTFMSNSDVRLWGSNLAAVTAQTNAQIDIAGRLDVVSRSGGQGGVAALQTTNNAGGASTALIHVGGGLVIDAQGLGQPSVVAPGGAGTGGRATLSASLGSIVVENGVTLQADGLGGSGASTGGAGAGGQVRISAAGGTLDLGVVDMHAVGSGGAGAAGGAATGGRLTVDLSEGPANENLVVSGSLAMTAAGATGTSGSIDMITRFHQPGSSVGFSSVTAFSEGAPNSTFPGFHLATDGGVLTVGAMNVNVPGLASFDALTPVGGGTVGALNVSEGLSVVADSISVEQLAPQGPGPLPTIHAREVDMNASTAFTGTNNASIDATMSVNIEVANGGASVPILTAGASVDVAAAGAITLGTVSSGGTADISSTGGVVTVTTDLNSATPANLTGTGVSVTGQGPMALGTVRATSQNLAVSTTGGLNVDDAQARGDISLTSSLDGVSVGAVQATSTGTAGPGAGPGAIVISAATNAALNGAVTARAALDVDAGGAITINGAARGAQVTLDSSDIDIGVNGRVGQSVTTSSVTFTNNSATRQTYIGGSGLAGAYNLSGAEINRVASDNLFINGSANTTSIDGLSVAGSSAGPFGAGGILGVSGLGAVNVVGALDVGGPLTGTGVRITAGNALTIGPGSSNGSVRVDGPLQLTGASILVNQAAAPGALDTVHAGSIAATAQTGFNTINNASVGSDGLLRVTVTGGGANVNNLSAGTALRLSTTGDILVGTAKSNGGLELGSTGGTVTVQVDLTNTTGANIQGTSVSLSDQNTLSLGVVSATTGNLTAEGRDGLTVENAQARGDVALTSSLGSVTVNAASTLVGDGTPPAGAGAGPGVIIIGAAQNATLNGPLEARSTLGARVGGLVTVNGLATGSAVNLESRDVDIAPGGVVGQSGLTDQVRFSNLGAGTMTFVGGAGSAGAYSLTGAELGRVRSANLTIDGGLGDVGVGALALTAGPAGPVAAGGRFAIDGGAEVSVTGAVNIDGLSDQGEVAITATEVVKIDNGAGSIVLRDGAGGLGGVLSLDAPVVVAASAAAFPDLQAAADIEARAARLAINDGAVSDGGILQARSIGIVAGDGFFVQNTGASDAPGDRRGLTFGAGGLAVTTSGPASQVVINGRADLGGGDFATGLEVLPLMTVNGVAPGPGAVFANLDPASSVNGCAITDFSPCRAIGPLPPGVEVVDLIVTALGNPLGGFPPPDSLEAADEFQEPDPDEEEPASEGSEAQAAAAAPRRTILIQGVGTGSTLPPVVDAPVGIGNDTLWIGQGGAGN